MSVQLAQLADNLSRYSCLPRQTEMLFPKTMTTRESTLRVAVIGGDGTGPEVTAEAVKCLKAASKKFGFGLEFVDYPFGAD